MEEPKKYSSYNEINGVKLVYPKSTLHELFAEQVKTFPDSIALEYEYEKITYKDLATKINQIANFLWLQGLRPGQIVAVSLDRTPELIAKFQKEHFRKSSFLFYFGNFKSNSSFT